MSNLSRALDIVTLADVWHLTDRFGQGVPVPVRDGVTRSPFQEDRNPSFSVSRGLRRWKDFQTGADAAGVIAFVERCRPEWSRDEVYRYIVERAGLPWADASKSSKPMTDAEREAWQRGKRKQEREARRARVLAAAVKREAALALPVAAMVEPMGWPACVQERWQDGVVALGSDEARVAELAAQRGWPEDWLWSLLDLGKVGWVALPWASGQSRVKRGIGFLVEAPWRGELRRIGYHVRFVLPTTDGGAARKSWVYVPSLPKERAYYSDYERELIAAADELGIDESQQWCEPLPFVLGQAPEASGALCILTEGQWDAITIWGALGGFYDGESGYDQLTKTLVLGIRGVHGMEPALRHWGGWISRVKPTIWILADNDKAGQVWDTAHRDWSGCVRPSVAERLREAGCRVTVTRVKPSVGKDFNDLWRVWQGEPQVVWAWLHKLGIFITER